MSLEKVIRNFGISKEDTEFVKVLEQVRKAKQQLYGTYTT